jgi:hypothetical protein
MVMEVTACSNEKQGARSSRFFLATSVRAVILEDSFLKVMWVMLAVVSQSLLHSHPKSRLNEELERGYLSIQARVFEKPE